MSEYIIPALITKTISFKRLDNKNVIGYKIYGLFKDNKYESGIREELLDEFDNPSEPNSTLTSKTYEFNKNYTWELPNDMYLDRDHRFKVFVNDFILSSMYYEYNKYNKIITINKNLKVLDPNDVIRIDYFKDIIIKTYSLEQNCDIRIKPIFRETYTYGTHNVVI